MELCFYCHAVQKIIFSFLGLSASISSVHPVNAHEISGVAGVSRACQSKGCPVGLYCGDGPSLVQVACIIIICVGCRVVASNLFWGEEFVMLTIMLHIEGYAIQSVSS